MRRSATTALLVLAVVLTGACGDDGAPNPDSASPSGGSTSGATAPPASPVDTTGPGTGPPASSTVAPTTTVAAEPRTVTIAATGDLLAHLPVQQQALAYGGGGAYDFTPMFADVAPELAAADLALCHQETPLSADNTALSGYPVFNAPRELATAAAAAGYDGCSTASNHSLDRGFTGVTQTLDVLDAVGLGHSGTARNAEEAANPPIYDVATDDGRVVRVGHLSYAYGFNGIPLPADAPFAANLLDETRILADAAALRVRGAQVVVVSLQWGVEYQAQPSAQQQATAAALLASPDIDVLLGSHVHVVQPIVRVGPKVVVYGLGNFLSNQTERPATQDGVIVHLELVEQPDGRFAVGAIRYTPTSVEHPGFVIRRAVPATNPASFERTTTALGLLGGFDGVPTTP